MTGGSELCLQIGRLYKDQLDLSERHLDNLLSDTTTALDLLASLSESFKSVDSQTTAFQAQCEDLLSEQKRVRELADEIGLNLQYYAYLEPLTRRLNAPGAGRIVKSDDFTDMLLNLNTCIDFMEEHVSLTTFRQSVCTKSSANLSGCKCVQDAIQLVVRESSQPGPDCIHDRPS